MNDNFLPDDSGMSYEEFRAMYRKRNKRSKLALVLDVVLLCAALITAVSAIVFYAVPVTQLGDAVDKGRTMNIFSFILFDDASMFNKLKDYNDILEYATNSGAELSPVIFLDMMRLFINFCIAVKILICAVIVLIKAPMQFSKKSDKLAITCIGNIKNTVLADIAFAFIGSKSGGFGNAKYYIGYRCGAILNFCLVLSLIAVVAVSAVKFFADRNFRSDKGKVTKWALNCITLILSFIMTCVLCDLRLFAVANNVVNTLQGVLIQIISNFEHFALDPKMFIYPVANAAIFLTAIMLYADTVDGAYRAAKYISSEYKNDVTFDKSYRGKRKQKSTRHFVSMIIFAIIGFVAYSVLQIPKYGYGFSVDVTLSFTVALLMGITGIVACFVGKRILAGKHYYDEDDITI